MEQEFFMAAYVDKNIILENHARWLFKNEYFDECKECLRQAEFYAKKYKNLKRTSVHTTPSASPCTAT